MKQLITAVLLSSCLFVALPARAADWEKEKIVCNVSVLELASITDIPHWGKWTKFTASFHRTDNKKLQRVEIFCYAKKLFDDYLCRLENVDTDSGLCLHGRGREIGLSFPMGTSQNKACQAIFDKFEIKKCSCLGCG